MTHFVSQLGMVVWSRSEGHFDGGVRFVTQFVLHLGRVVWSRLEGHSDGGVRLATQYVSHLGGWDRVGFLMSLSSIAY